MAALGDGTFASRDLPVVVLREDGAGSLETNDWFLDLDPAIAKTIPADRIPVFLVVTQSASGAITATVKFRGQDVGSTANIYIFAVAPASTVQGADAKKARGRWDSRRGSDGTKDGGNPCVLTQLGSSGQLAPASASTLQAYMSGVLNSQGQAVTILNNGTTQNVAGATFYVGYGASSGTMITNGTNRSAVTVPGCGHLPAAGAADRLVVESGRGRARLLDRGAGRPHLLRRVPLRRVGARDLERRAAAPRRSTVRSSRATCCDVSRRADARRPLRGIPAASPTRAASRSPSPTRRTAR